MHPPESGNSTGAALAAAAEEEKEEEGSGRPREGIKVAQKERMPNV